MLEESLLDLQAKDPKKLIHQLTLRAERVQALAKHIKYVESALSAETVDAAINTRTEVRAKKEEAKRLGTRRSRRGCYPERAREHGPRCGSLPADSQKDSPISASPFRLWTKGQAAYSASRTWTTPLVTGFSSSRNSSLRPPSRNSGGPKKIRATAEDLHRNEGRNRVH